MLFAYYLKETRENKEYKVPFTNVRTYKLSCSNKLFKTSSTFSFLKCLFSNYQIFTLFSSHLVLPAVRSDKFINNAVEYS